MVYCGTYYNLTLVEWCGMFLAPAVYTAVTVKHVAAWFLMLGTLGLQ